MSRLIRPAPDWAPVAFYCVVGTVMVVFFLARPQDWPTSWPGMLDSLIRLGWFLGVLVVAIGVLAFVGWRQGRR